MTFLIGCAGVGSEAPNSACLPVVEYSRSGQVQVAQEVAALPEGALIVGRMVDYAVLWDLVKDCKLSRNFYSGF